MMISSILGASTMLNVLIQHLSLQSLSWTKIWRAFRASDPSRGKQENKEKEERERKREREGERERSWERGRAIEREKEIRGERSVIEREKTRYIEREREGEPLSFLFLSFSFFN